MGGGGGRRRVLWCGCLSPGGLEVWRSGGPEVLEVLEVLDAWILESRRVAEGKEQGEEE